jgi:hypothetical protein
MAQPGRTGGTGAGTVTAVRGYRLFVDWSNSGTFANALEDVTNYVNRTDITFGWGRKVDSLDLGAPTAQLGFELFNRGLHWDRYFSPENTSSPIYGAIYPGRTVRFERTHLGAIYPLHVGVLDSLAVADDTARTFSGLSMDDWGRPDGEKLSTQLYSGIRTGDAINIVLDAIGWTGARAIDPGATLMPWWWAEGIDAATAVTDLVNSEGPPAIAYVEAGTFVFRDRHHRILSSRSRTSQALYTRILPAGSGPVGDFKIDQGTWTYDHGTKYIANSASFAVEIRTAQQPQQVYTITDPISMLNGDVLTIFAQPSDPVLNAVAPVVGTDLIPLSGSFTATIGRTSGQVIPITITCTGDGVISSLALQAQPVTVSRTVQITASDPSSISRYGTQAWPATAPWCSPYDAQAIANRIVAVYADNQPRVVLTITWAPTRPGADRYMTEILSRKISDRITIRNDVNGVNRDFYVERIDHVVSKLLVHRLQLSCVVTEPVQPANVFTFDVAGRGFDQGAFGVGGIDTFGSMFVFDTAGQGFDQGQFAN